MWQEKITFWKSDFSDPSVWQNQWSEVRLYPEVLARFVMDMTNQKQIPSLSPFLIKNVILEIKEKSFLNVLCKKESRSATGKMMPG